MKRDGASTSLWQHNMPGYTTKSTNHDTGKIYDVIIIGAGITGMSTALLLQHAGKSCIVAEANTVGFGTTGGTTAHLNTFFDTPYSKVSKNFSDENASLLAQGAKAAMALIKQNISSYNIDCSYEDMTGYIFSLNELQDKELDDLVESTQKVGLPMDYVNDSPFPIPYLKVASIQDQAQFHPAKYIYGLAKAYEELGGVLLQHCRVTDLEKGELIEVQTSQGIIKAKNAIYATHIPPGVNLLHFRCAPYRSYALGVKLKGKYPMALGYDMNDPYHYYRTQEVDGEKYLIAGGEDHKTGHEDNTQACFRKLESHVRSYFEVEEAAFRWSSQYYEPADGLPYIGHLPGGGDNVYVATGFGGNGMIYGTLSAMILSNLLVNGESLYHKLFNPKRLKPMAGFSNFIKEGTDVVIEFLSGKFAGAKMKEIADMAAGEAKIVKYEGHTMALFKDMNHQVHAVNPACTHIKCTVAWNAVESSWDCPCHGSRFTVDGEVLTAPAQKDLQKINIASEE